MITLPGFNSNYEGVKNQGHSVCKKNQNPGLHQHNSFAKLLYATLKQIEKHKVQLGQSSEMPNKLRKSENQTLTLNIRIVEKIELNYYTHFL